MPIITAYQVGETALDLVPASKTRPWVEQMPGRNATRCLPLMIGSSYGWTMLSPCSFGAYWRGTQTPGMVEFDCHPDDEALLPESHFEAPAVTWHPGYLFVTPPGWDLFVTGPINHPKPGVQYLSAIIETDRAAETFTYNVRLCEPHQWIWWDAGEPICQFFPIPSADIENWEPRIAPIDTNPELFERYKEWGERRDAALAGEEEPEGKRLMYTQEAKKRNIRAPSWSRVDFSSEGG